MLAELLAGLTSWEHFSWMAEFLTKSHPRQCTRWSSHTETEKLLKGWRYLNMRKYLIATFSWIKKKSFSTALVSAFVMPGQKQSWGSLFSLSWGFLGVFGGFWQLVVLLRPFLGVPSECNSEQRQQRWECGIWNLFPEVFLHFTLLWKKTAVILQMAQLQMELLLCSCVHGGVERLKAAVSQNWQLWFLCLYL